ncbi:MAG: type II toxin-antitoxin system RelE/ParE family toxin [Prosthecobacter sp.]
MSPILPDTREILVFKSSYRIIYRIDEEHQLIEVLRFWHGHQDEPDWGEA